MDFAFTEEQTLLRNSVQKFVQNGYTFDNRRAIVNNGALVFNTTSSLNVANTISGSGTFTQAGTRVKRWRARCRSGRGTANHGDTCVCRASPWSGGAGFSGCPASRSRCRRMC